MSATATVIAQPVPLSFAPDSAAQYLPIQGPVVTVSAQPLVQGAVPLQAPVVEVVQAPVAEVVQAPVAEVVQAPVAVPLSPIPTLHSMPAPVFAPAMPAPAAPMIGAQEAPVAVQTFAPSIFAPMEQVAPTQMVAPVPVAVIPTVVQTENNDVNPLTALYLNQLTTPLFQALSQPGITVEALYQWLQSAAAIFPPETIASFMAHVTVSAIAQSIIRYIQMRLALIPESVVEHSPWGVLRVLQQFPVLAQVLTVAPGPIALPIMVICGPIGYEHLMTEDQVAGFLAYPNPVPVQLSFLCHPIERKWLEVPTEMDIQDGFVQIGIPDKFWVIGRDASLISGYLTAANWAGDSTAATTIAIKQYQNGQALIMSMA